VRVLDEDVEHLRAGEILPETMRCRGLDTTAGGGDKAFNGRCVEATSELFLLGLDARNDGDGEEVFIHLAIEVKDLAHFGVGFRFGEICSVTFLPEELACS
jgi:hypothetical protein